MPGHPSHVKVPAFLSTITYHLSTGLPVKELPNCTTSPPRVMCPGNTIEKNLMSTMSPVFTPLGERVGVRGHLFFVASLLEHVGC
jgi:hypothetical protein